MEVKRQSHCWWFDSHNNPRCSSWLQSTLAELDAKTKGMLKLIEEDADSFAQRAEMYYKKRPELISMVEDFYRTHRSLAEKYDQLRLDPSTRVRSALRLSLPVPLKAEYPESVLDSCKSFDSFSEEESVDSEIDDPEEVEADAGSENRELREELERLREENEVQRKLIKQKDRENEMLVTKSSDKIDELKNQLKQKEKENEEVKRGLLRMRQEMQAENGCLKDELVQKDEKKREVIRQLSSAMDMIREENRALRKSIAMKDSNRKRVPSEIQMFKGVGLGKLFGFSSKCQASVVPL